MDLREVPQLPAGAIYQKDGAPSYFALEVLKIFMRLFPNSGLVEDPRHSLGHLGYQIYYPWIFFLWGFVKDQVYRTPVADLDDLKLRSLLAIQNVTIDILRNTWREVENRLDICRAINGSHVEVFLDEMVYRSGRQHSLNWVKGKCSRIRYRAYPPADTNAPAEYYFKIMEVIDALDSTDSSAVAAVKSLPSEQLLEDILFIDSNFKIVSKSITCMKDDDGNWNYNITECEQQFPDYIITEYFRRNVIHLVHKFRATDCTERKKSVRWPTKVTEDAVEDARERMQRGRNKSVKKLAVEIGVSYGSAHKILRKTWVLNKNTCKQLAVFERKILRRIFGAIETVDGWRARYNNEIYELYKESDLEAHIRCQRLRWLGHVTRMETTRKVKIVFNNNPDGTRLRGRPRTRWWNCV
ncbi:hypothetical protein ANN_26522 [Periplaneta americana]|uniref:Uncharacterized protein n=1 Tax=Periplaneta americana TaxID=6978 RepID=A0ABQ8RYG6_PERAM|nr:hypothetical protein ANN_26522 [Periplaneta americana]